MTDPTVLALDISGSRAFLAVVSGGVITERREVANTAADARSYWPAILAAAEELVRLGRPRAIGVSFGGPVSREGRLLSLHVGGWQAVEPAADLARFGLPVRFENDANCGAVGEALCGAWGEPQTLVFMTCSTGIGSGIWSDGQLYRGARGLAGEVGHTVVDPAGRPCCCGSRGCLEAHCSGTAIALRATEALADWPASLLHQTPLVDGRLPGAQPVFAAAAAGDQLARVVLDAVFSDFGRGLATVQHAFDPTQIVIGGGVALAGEAFFGPLREATRPWLMASRRDDFRLAPAACGLDAQLLGAAALARDLAAG